MARKKAPKNKAITQAPETQDNDLLTALAEKDAQLRRLLKAENNEFSGVIGRHELHRMANLIRTELRGGKEVDMGVDDE